MRCAVLNSPHRSASGEDWDVDDFALTPAERRLFSALRARGVRFLIVGLGAAVLERVIASKRATSRPKDLASLPALEATLRARSASE
jgi:hypothetical protein